MRTVEHDFIKAMNEGLEHGRQEGRTWWDSKWEVIPEGATTDDLLADLIHKYHEESRELLDAVAGGSDLVIAGEVRKEAADVANMVMMIADVLGTLDSIHVR